MDKVKQELIMELSIMAKQMRRIADKMETLKENHWQNHASQIRGASEMAATWVEGLKDEITKISENGQ